MGQQKYRGGGEGRAREREKTATHEERTQVRIPARGERGADLRERVCGVGVVRGGGERAREVRVAVGIRVEIGVGVVVGVVVVVVDRAGPVDDVRRGGALEEDGVAEEGVAPREVEARRVGGGGLHAVVRG